MILSRKLIMIHPEGSYRLMYFTFQVQRLLTKGHIFSVKIIPTF